MEIETKHLGRNNRRLETNTAPGQRSRLYTTYLRCLCRICTKSLRMERESRSPIRIDLERWPHYKLRRHGNTPKTKFDNNFFNIVPYVTLSWQPRDMQTFKLSYTQRLSRPGIWQLNPFKDSSTPHATGIW